MLICLDFGGSSIKYGLIDPSEPRVVKEKGEVRNTFADQQEFLSAVYDLVNDLKDRFPADGIAVSYCGELDHETGLIHSPGTYNYNAELPLGSLLENKFRMPVSVENDGNAAMLAEWRFGALQNCENAAMIVLGTGIGGSFIVDGKLHTGKNGFSGMLSFCLTDLEKPVDMNNMAMSSMASRYLIKEFLRSKGAELPDDSEAATAVYEGRPFNGKEFFRLYHEGDQEADRVLTAYAGNVVRFILTLHCILELEAVAIGGGISAQQALLDHIRQEADAVFGPTGLGVLHLPAPRIVRAEFGSDANLVGAALWFLEQHSNV